MSTTIKLRYANNHSFAKLPTYQQISQIVDPKQIDVGIVGIPFDSGCSFRTGSRFAPSEIRKVSCILREYNIKMQDYPFKNQNIVDFLDLNITPFSIDQAIDDMYVGFTNVLKIANKYIILGGDHTLSYPSLKAIHSKHGKVCLLHFDAHLDTCDTHFGCKFTHGTPFKRAFDDDLLSNKKFHVGLRGGTYSEEDLSADHNLEFKIYPADIFNDTNCENIMREICDTNGTEKVYVSIDIDVIDPAFAPATGTPEVGGFSSREFLKMLRCLRGLNIVGADIVEVLPAYDNQAQTTAMIASTICYELLTLIKHV